MGTRKESKLWLSEKIKTLVMKSTGWEHSPNPW